jgi:hypothetical protein
MAIERLQAASPGQKLARAFIYLCGVVRFLFRAAAAHVMISADLQGTLFGQHELGIKAPPPLM